MGLGLLTGPRPRPSSCGWRSRSPPRRTQGRPDRRESPESGLQSPRWESVIPGPLPHWAHPARLVRTRTRTPPARAQPHPQPPCRPRRPRRPRSRAALVPTWLQRRQGSDRWATKPRPCVHRPPRSPAARPAASPDPHVTRRSHVTLRAAQRIVVVVVSVSEEGRGFGRPPLSREQWDSRPARGLMSHKRAAPRQPGGSLQSCPNPALPEAPFPLHSTDLLTSTTPPKAPSKKPP